MRTWHGLPENDDPFVTEYMKVTDAFYDGRMTEDDWHEWYDRRLKVVLRHVTAKSDFYRKHLAGIDIDKINLESLSQLPFTTKADLQAAKYDILSGSVRDAQFYYATTGTTGPSTPCPRDKKDLFTTNTQIAYGMRRLLNAHLPGIKPLLAVLAPNELHSICNTFAAVSAELGICKLDPYPASLVIGFEKCVKLLQELKVDVVLGTPGLALILAQICEMYGIDPKRDLAIKLFLSTGEICTPAMERNIESIYGCKLFNFIYASQEAATMALASPDNTYYPTLPNYIFEVVDPDSERSFGHTGRGELCVTMLIDGIKPLIRYRTGDLVTIQEDDKAAGPYRYVVQVLGRKKDLVALGGHPVAARELEQQIMEELHSCVGYQIVIDSHDDADQLQINLQVQHGADIYKDQVRERLSAKLQQKFGVATTTTFVLQLDDIVNTGGWISWKAARVIDRRANADQRMGEALAFERQMARQLATSADPLIL
jgi:phenylacetate-CoA ligase